MNHWPFIIVAYGITLAATLALIIWARQAMQRAEADAEAVKRQ